MVVKMEISKRQWNNIHKKLNSLKDEVVELKSILPKREMKYLKFEECIPPASICKDVNSMMNGISSYEGFIGRLSNYYGCETMGLYVDKKMDIKHIAEYRSLTRDAYTRKTTCEKNTVLHEYFHHLVNLKVVIVDKKKEEYYADKYTKVFMERVNSD